MSRGVLAVFCCAWSGFTVQAQPPDDFKTIESQLGGIESRLAKISGHEGAKASILYPYQLARAIDAGKRQYSQRDFGIPWDEKQPPYDFAAGLRASAELLKQIESGNDPLFRATGDHERHYWFE